MSDREQHEFAQRTFDVLAPDVVLLEQENLVVILALERGEQLVGEVVDGLLSLIVLPRWAG